MSNSDGSKGLLNNLYTGGPVMQAPPITASYLGLSASASVMVAPATITDIWINPVNAKSLTVIQGNFQQLLILTTAPV